MDGRVARVSRDRARGETSRPKVQQQGCESEGKGQQAGKQCVSTWAKAPQLATEQAPQPAARDLRGWAAGDTVSQDSPLREERKMYLVSPVSHWSELTLWQF